MTIMNEIVGESGENTGKGCLMAVAAILTVVSVLAWVWLAR